MAIVNVVGSSIAREADKVFYTLAGPEISVATTKAYSAQLVAMYCIAVQFAKVREKITEEQYHCYISEMLTLPEKIQKILEDLKHQNNQFPHMDQQGRQRLVHLRKIPLHPSDRQQQEQWPGMVRRRAFFENCASHSRYVNGRT